MAKISNWSEYVYERTETKWGEGPAIIIPKDDTELYPEEINGIQIKNEQGGIPIPRGTDIAVAIFKIWQCLDTAAKACEEQAKEFYIEGYRLYENFGGIEGNSILEAYGNNNCAVYAQL